MVGIVSCSTFQANTWTTFSEAVGDHIHAVSWHLRNIASQNCQSFKPPQACDHKLQARLDELYSWIVIQYCACWYTSETIANYKHQILSTSTCQLHIPKSFKWYSAMASSSVCIQQSRWRQASRKSLPMAPAMCPTKDTLYLQTESIVPKDLPGLWVAQTQD
jgi:hypothetical protein